MKSIATEAPVGNTTGMQQAGESPGEGNAYPAVAHTPTAEQAAVRVLIALALSHGLNDAIQALLPSIYPLLKTTHGLTFTQVGLITFVFQLAGSLLQPVVGHYTDRRPLPYSLPIGMSVTLVGLILLAEAGSFSAILVAAALVGTGSAVFHPEASRLARLASGGRHGFAQAFFQVGGNFGSSIGPLLAAWVVVPRGQRHLLWFTLIALAAIVVLSAVGAWYQRHLVEMRRQRAPRVAPSRPPLTARRTVWALVVLGVLIFSKFFYTASITSYYTFYLIDRFGISTERAQHYLFIFLFAFAVGTIVGGPVGDRWGRRRVIWASILGAAPFTLALPHATSLVGVGALSVCVGVVIASAFSAILVFAQELVPGRVGTIAGLFFGFAFGMAGIGSAVLGRLADLTSIAYVFDVCAWLPLLGVFTVLLPDVERGRVG